MEKREERIDNLFNDETGNSVMLPMDHGIMLGVQQGLEDPIEALKRFVKLGPDALLVNFGVLKQAREYLSGLDDPPATILAADFNQMWPSWKTPIDADEIIGHCNILDLGIAEEYGADAVKVLLPLGLSPDLYLDYVKHVSEVVNEGEKHDMPVMIEPTTMGDYIDEERKNDPEIIADGCRIGLELGADVLKAPYPGPGGYEGFREICDNANVPVVMLGGPKRDGLRGVLESARQGVDAGARGTIFGRNVWQRPVEEMKRVVASLQEIVHEGASVDAVMEEYDLE
ncbi:hypothetical protein KGY64_03865 [Candidatus Bipolaricaulota bacterium]|nr:hypothetical protein [Candidatus Bipolaricaulota bacterium]